MDNKALNDALTAGVKEALGSLQFLVISLQAENAVLRAEAARPLADAEVLFALKELLADIEDYQSRNNIGGSDNHAQAQARFAIAKAERSTA